MESRFKRFYLGDDLIEAVLNWKQLEYIQLPVFPQLPDDATFHHIHYDMARRAFGILVHSDEFDAIPEGVMPSEVEGVLEFQSVQLVVEEPSDQGKG